MKFLMMINRKAFTLIEVLIAVSILCVLLIGVYQLFIGGSKTANKGQWINNTVEQTRNALTLISNEINSATYPTTMLKDTIYDPCDNKDKSIAKKYYLRILKDGEEIKTPSNGEIKIMKWQVCNTEKPEENANGKIIDYELYLSHNKTLSSSRHTGSLILKTKAYEFNTDKKNNYAKSGKLNLTPISSETKNRTLVEDVEYVQFSVIGNVPPKNSVDFSPISIKILTLYSKDLNVSKENSISATPKVAIDLL